MNSTDHWNEVYSKKSEDELSLHRDDPSVALNLMKEASLTTMSPVIDIGVGTSRFIEPLVDFLTIPPLSIYQKVRLRQPKPRWGSAISS
ncbi:hypothetical protein [Sulfitobacter sp. 1A13421]|uniref:hypothetical protein n=1 Tax=Sulfitobacter sp. 1A13421 TaxID=3368595 RepID=UPI0037482E08